MSPVLKPIPSGAGVNEVPRSKVSHFAAQFQLPKDGCYEEAKGSLRSAWRMRPRGAPSGIQLGDGVGSRE